VIPKRSLLAVAVLLAVSFLAWWLWQKRGDPDAWFRRLPGENVLLLHLDVAALRATTSLSPLLQSQVPPDPDYAAFVRQTGFDYQRDLDQAAVCYLSDRVYILARGRFDPARLRAYAQAQGGACPGDRPCHMPASQPGRRISFLLLASDTLALATAPETDAVLALQKEPTVNATPLVQTAKTMNGGSGLLWLTAAPSTLGQALPGGVAILAGALSKAQRAYLFLNPQPAGVQVVLHAVCASEAQAAETRRLLQGIHDLIGGLARKGPAEWTKVLNSAIVDQQGTVARVTWLLDAEILRQLGTLTTGATGSGSSNPDRTTGRSPGSDRPAGTGKD
jgi:hypothetical protein